MAGAFQRYQADGKWVTVAISTRIRVLTRVIAVTGQQASNSNSSPGEESKESKESTDADAEAAATAATAASQPAEKLVRIPVDGHSIV